MFGYRHQLLSKLLLVFGEHLLHLQRNGLPSSVLLLILFTEAEIRYQNIVSVVLFVSLKTNKNMMNMQVIIS